MPTADRDPEPDAAPLPFERLDFVYMPSRDVAADTRYFTETLGGRLIFAVEGMGARVAMIELTEGPPRILLADHLEGDRPILVYRVASFDDALEAAQGARLEARAEHRDPARAALLVHHPGRPAARRL